VRFAVGVFSLPSILAKNLTPCLTSLIGAYGFRLTLIGSKNPQALSACARTKASSSRSAARAHAPHARASCPEVPAASGSGKRRSRLQVEARHAACCSVRSLQAPLRLRTASYIMAIDRLERKRSRWFRGEVIEGTSYESRTTASSKRVQFVAAARPRARPGLIEHRSRHCGITRASPRQPDQVLITRRCCG
jgi:hypothetical protein